jgi:hypothetical protein
MRASATITSGNAVDPVKGNVGPGPTGGVVTLVPFTVTVVDDEDGCCSALTGTVSVVVLDGTLPVTTGNVTTGKVTIGADVVDVLAAVVDVTAAVVGVSTLVGGAAVDVVTMPGPTRSVVLVVVVSHNVVLGDDQWGLFEVVAPALDALTSANASKKQPMSIDATPASRAAPALTFFPSTRPVPSTRMCASRNRRRARNAERVVEDGIRIRPKRRGSSRR